MSILRGIHRHEMIDLGKYYHVYDTMHRERDFKYSPSTQYGTHVEINLLRICQICGKTEIETLDDRMFELGVNYDDMPDYIAELETEGILSEKAMVKLAGERATFIRAAHDL